jgi:hypothetical protein
MDFSRWQWHYNKTQHTKIHHAQTKYRTQSYTSNKKQITHNEYNAKKSRAIPVTGRVGL